MSEKAPVNDAQPRPTMCRNCGAIVGAGESQCAVCGASIGQKQAPKSPPPVADRETIRFARAILNRPYKFTIILLVANLFVFFLMWGSSGTDNQTLWLFPEQVLLAYGAKMNRLIDEQNQWWRFITPMFVHVGLIHLLVNMYGLWIIGPYVERLYGSARFVVIWVLTGIAGVLASYLSVVESGTAVGPVERFLFKTHDLPSAGASGALFGLIGVLFVFGIKFRKELPEGFKRAFGTGLLPIIAINLFIGYLGRGLIDNAAHLGGMLFGAVLALFIGYRRPGERGSVAIIWRVLQSAMLALVAISFVKVVQNFPSPLTSPTMAQTFQLDKKGADFVVYAKAINDGQETLYSALFENDARGIDRSVKAIESVPSLDAEADELRTELKDLLTEASKVAGEAGAAKERAESKKLATAFESWKKRYTRWLKVTGSTYGAAIEAEAHQ